MKIYLCGFMGSGKSFYFEKWSKELDPQACLDFDLELTKKSPYSSISEWVSADGWEPFRACELELIKESLNNESVRLISLGGGSLSEEALKLFKESEVAKLLWVDTPFSECWERIKDDSSRPLTLKGRDFCEKLHQERVALYKEADFSLNQLDEAKLLEIKRNLLG